jgi:serine/threonine protein kinase/Tol biopolymer transport system component
MTGRTISHYQVLEKLGEGGMGEVWKARDTRLNRLVAIKALPPDKTADPDRKARFVQEARAASALNHPNIVTIHDILSEDGHDFIVMEFVAGKTLAAKIAGKELRLPDTLKYGVQIADALARAHSGGIIHRDLKPSNVMVSDTGLAKVLDFGLAKLTGGEASAEASTVTQAQTGPGVVVGTVGYMSPEQVRGQAVDHRSDIFNLGLVLYEMLAGKRAFTGQSSIDVMSAILKEPTPELPESVPGGLREIVSNCLEKEAANRFESARDLAFALRALSTGSGISAVAAKIEAPPKKRRWALPAVAVALALIAVALAARILLTDDRSVDLANYKLTPFATALTQQSWPAWSPDDKSIAYIGTAKGSDQLIYVQKLDSTRPQPMTRPPFVGVPSWTRDSRELYFNATAAGGSGLWKVSAAGGQPTLVQGDADGGGLGLSPDGRTLAFLRRSQRTGSFEVWVASPPEAPARQYEPSPFQGAGVTNLSYVRFAPDGRKILVQNGPYDREEEVWLLPWPPGQSRRVFFDLPETRSSGGYSWMPDSRHVVFQMMVGPSLVQRLFMGDTNTGRAWPVLVESRRTGNASVSPDGTKVVYQSILNQFNAVEVPIDGGPAQDLLRSYGREYMPAFSRKERTLVYVTDRRGDLEVWMESLTEQWARLLLKPSDFRLPSGRSFYLMTPVLSPDSQWVAVVGGSRLWISGVAGGSAPVRITAEEAAVESAPTWSPDGQWIAYLRSRQGQATLTKVKVGASQPPVDLAEALSSTSLPEWSPTGEWIACTVTGKPGITLVSPDGKNTRLLPGVSAPHAWSIDGKTIYQVRGTNNCSLAAVDVATGKDRVIRELGELCPGTPLYPGYRITVAPDGKSIAYAVDRSRSELWILEGLRIPRPWFQRLLGKLP